MAKPWEAYSTGGAAPVNEDGEEDPGLKVTVTDDSPAAPAEEPDAPPSEMAAQPHEAVAGQPWAEYGTAAPSNEAPDEGLTGEVHAEHFVDDNGNPVDEHGKPLGGPPAAPQTNAGDAWAGLQSGALMGFDDELRAGAGVVGNKLGHALGLNHSNMSAGDIYDILLQQERERKDAAFKDNPTMYGAGFLPGMLLSAPLAEFRAAEGAGLGARVGAAAATGAVQGAGQGIGNADGGLVNRLEGGAEGAALGAGLGTAMYPLAAGAQNVGGRLWRAVTPRGPNSLNSGLDALAARAPQDAAAMRASADAATAAGVPSRLVDHVDASGRGVITDAASKMTPARQAVESHADEVYASAGDRVAQQANRHISSQPGTARQLGHTISAEQEALGPSFDAVRNAPVELTPDIVKALDTADGRNALRTAGRMMTPEEQGSLNTLISAMKQARDLGTPAEQAAKMFPGFTGMGQAAKDSVIKQLTEQGVIKDPMANAKLTVDIADKFARILTNKAKDTPALLRVAKQYGDTVRGAARDQVPAYGDALDAFAANAGVGNAAAGEGKFADTNFLTTPPDEYARGVNAAATTKLTPTEGYTGPGVSERDALAMRARDEVRDAATAGSGARAPAVARQIAQGSQEYGQGARNEALLGAEPARALEASMAHEASRVENTRAIDPRTGSQTYQRGHDAIVDGFASAVSSAASASSPWWAAVRTAGKWLKQGGLRGIDAERLARDAISEDPARVDAAITYLENKGMARARATRFVSTYASALAGRAGAAMAVSDNSQSPPPPNSVRSLMSNPVVGK